MGLSVFRHARVRDRLRMACGATAFALLCMASSGGPAEAKTPGKTYCFNGVCHHVLSIPEMVAIVGRDQVFQASYYDDCRHDRYNPCGLTSSGEAFRPNESNSAASPIYPDGTILLIRNPDNGNAAVVRVNNAGPYWRQRMLDVSRATAEKLGFADAGVAKLEVRVMSAPSIIDATYKRNRHYAPVPGPIGTFASLDQAQGGMMVAMAIDAMSTSVFAPVAGKMLTAVKTMPRALANALRTDTTRVASADATLPPNIVANIEKNLGLAETPKPPAGASETARGKATVTAASSAHRRHIVRARHTAKVRGRARWARSLAPQRHIRAIRALSSRSSRRGFATVHGSPAKSAYWTSRRQVSRQVLLKARRGPRAMRFATR
ncbi:MAG: hypothetical protein JSR99_19635 [Proteobacteria bacterium]|nr:hypothetical protein [Pseudomonadota bacterium]